MATARKLCCWSLFFVCATVALAQTPDAILANSNHASAGKLQNGILNVKLEIRAGVWHPEAENGPQLFVQAFAEEGHPAQIPGPMLRMPEGTMVHATVTNKLTKKATVYGLNIRPGDAKTGIELAPNESRELTFVAGAPGTYFYWARTTDMFKTATGRIIERPLFADAQLNGAFIVDPVDSVTADRVFVINTMLVPADVAHERFEVLTINGKSYPFTEPLEYPVGKAIRWRVINPGPSEHPMHLHGSFYKLLSTGDSQTDTTFAQNNQQSVVTENLLAGRTMMMEWTPQHIGRWLFHCHFQQHIATEKRVPMLTRLSDSPADDHWMHEPNGMSGMNDMAGLVLFINVKGSAPAPTATAPPHRVDLVIEPMDSAGALPTFSCAVREGKKIVASQDKSIGPPIVLTRGEPAEVTVVNHLSAPTTIHWHGLELDSYYDGVIGEGTGNQVTPPVAPGKTFTARFTPSRAGTFIYHTHSPDPNQLSGGIYGPLIVLEPGQTHDPEHDKVLLLGTRDTPFTATRLTLNGMEAPAPITFTHGTKYRLRLINMGPNLAADFQLGDKDHTVMWRAIAKDGADLPPSLATTGPAVLHLASGEAYDFEFQPDTAGEIPLQVVNSVNLAKLIARLEVN